MRNGTIATICNDMNIRWNVDVFLKITTTSMRMSFFVFSNALVDFLPLEVCEIFRFASCTACFEFFLTVPIFSPIRSLIKTQPTMVLAIMMIMIMMIMMPVVVMVLMKVVLVMKVIMAHNVFQ